MKMMKIRKINFRINKTMAKEMMMGQPVKIMMLEKMDTLIFINCTNIDNGFK